MSADICMYVSIPSNSKNASSAAQDTVVVLSRLKESDERPYKQRMYLG